MYNDIAFWTSVAIVEVSHYAAFTNCKEKKPHKSHMSIIQYHLFKEEEQLHPDFSKFVRDKMKQVFQLLNSSKQQLSACTGYNTPACSVRIIQTNNPNPTDAKVRVQCCNCVTQNKSRAKKTKY